MAVKDPATMAANWKAAMQNPQTAAKYKAGIQAVTENPMAKAASPEAEQLYLNNVQLSVSSGKRSAKLNAVPMSRWQGNAINIGSTLLSSGASKAIDKVTAHFQKWAPIYQQAHTAVQGMPKGGLVNAMARVQAVVQMFMTAAGRA